MSLDVRAGTKEEILSRDTSCPNRAGVGPSLAPAGSPRFLAAMEEGFSSGETSQVSVFNTPAARSGTFFENLRMRIVEFLLPAGFEVVREEDGMDMREFFANVRELWTEYEPLLGGRNTPVSTLQIENPFEEDE